MSGGRLAAAVPETAKETVAVALEALGRYRVRTALSVIGVVLGVAAVIAMMSVTEGAREEALRQVELLGLDNVMVRNRYLTPEEAREIRPVGLTVADASRLVEVVPFVERAEPLVERQAEVRGGESAGFARIVGVSAGYAELVRLSAARGRLIAPLDVRSAAHVCVLGAGLSRRLFGYRDPIGEALQIEDTTCVAVGVLAERASGPNAVQSRVARDLNQAVLLPISVPLGQPPAGDPSQPIDEVWLRVASDRLEESGRIVREAIVRLHGGVEDVDVVVPSELLEQRYQTQRTFSVVVGSIAAISLLVGGVGIMNIMLASVLERTREIGLRRTVGATRRDIAAQFLVESLAMTLSGGFAGLILGVGAAWVITAYSGWTTSISWTAVFMALLVSSAMGLTFGIYPATRAARLEPIDALRWE